MHIASPNQITPLERLYCMKHTLENIVKDVEKHQQQLQQQQRRRGGGGGGGGGAGGGGGGGRGGGGGGGRGLGVETITINSDDLIPLLCAVVTK